MADNYKRYAVELLKELISIPTVNQPGNEKPLAEYIAKILIGIGIESHVNDIGNNRANVWAQIGKGTGKTLMFNGHLDVVPAGNEWKYKPFEPIEVDGKVYGRGATDMKGAIAAMITATKYLHENNFQIPGRLKLLFVADEESGNMGTKTYLKSGDSVDFAIIGEPTNMEIAVAHKGVARFIIEIYGKAAHASTPERGVNSIVNAAKAITALKEYNMKLRKQKHDLLTPPSVAITMIKGGEKENTIPDRCEIMIDRRTLPSDTYQSVEAELIQVMDEIAKEDKSVNYQIKPYFYLMPGEIDLEDNFVKLCQKVGYECFGKPPQIKGFGACCEQALYLQNGIATIVCGPGSLEQAHIADEFIEIDQLYKAVDFYIHLVKSVL